MYNDINCFQNYDDDQISESNFFSVKNSQKMLQAMTFHITAYKSISKCNLGNQALNPFQCRNLILLRFMKKLQKSSLSLTFRTLKDLSV